MAYEGKFPASVAISSYIGEQKVSGCKLRSGNCAQENAKIGASAAWPGNAGTLDVRGGPPSRPIIPRPTGRRRDPGGHGQNCQMARSARDRQNGHFGGPWPARERVFFSLAWAGSVVSLAHELLHDVGHVEALATLHRRVLGQGGEVLLHQFTQRAGLPGYLLDQMAIAV